MIFLFTDFGLRDWYVGQMRAVLTQVAPEVPVIDLMHGVAPFDVRAGAYLLGALASRLPEGAVTVGVVDPGVGGTRWPLAIEADGRWFVGPDNGLFSLVWRRAGSRRALAINWRPQDLSNSFHGRDLFAPVAAKLARGSLPATTEIADPMAPSEWPDDLWQVIHLDRFGNAVTGITGATVDERLVLQSRGRLIQHARTFGDAAPGTLFWYRNSLNLVEIACAGASAADKGDLALGDPIATLNK